MSILNSYVLRGFLGAFLMAIAILTFGMTGANMIKVLKYVSQGVPLGTFLEFTLYLLPIVLTFTIPWAVMVAVMLVFGRMSADNEITAMRACGISIMQIVSPILIVTFFLTLLCLYLQVEVGPPLLGKSRDMLEISAVEHPQAIFEPGKQISYQNTIIYIDDKEGPNRLKGIDLYVLSGDNSYSQNISAAYGDFEVDTVKKRLKITMHDCMIDNKKAESAENVGRFFSKEFVFTFDYGKINNAERLWIRDKYMKLADLMGRIRMVKKLNHDTTDLEVELNQRIAFALAPIAFLLLGLPLAIRTNRRETSVGLFLSVILAGFYFLSIILCESLTKFKWLYPQYLLWLPNIAFQILGAVMTYKISRR